MQIREYSLPKGWFPHDSSSVTAFLFEFNSKKNAKSFAAISPHAGWYYSGHTAALGAASLQPDADTIIVIGGHLAAGSPPLFAMEEAVRTPFGYLSIDTALRAALLKELNGADDRYRDNTVEVLLPMVHYFFPDAQVLWLRLPADISSFKAGKTISRITSALKRNVNVLASADLTHYGRNYGFSPKGSGKAALRWVREVNDAILIKAIESADSKEVLRCADEDSSTCSAGAILGAMGFAEEKGLGNARLLEYTTSADITGDENPDSFVGYASFAFP